MIFFDNGDGSYSRWPAPLTDEEFGELVPTGSRRRWGIFKTLYVSVSGQVTPRHDPYGVFLRIFGLVSDVLIVIGALAFLFFVALCCIPALAHLVF